MSVSWSTGPSREPTRHWPRVCTGQGGTRGRVASFPRATRARAAPSTPPAQERAMTRVDEAVEKLERLYTSVTGMPAPTGAGPYAPIPPEKDPVRHVVEQLDRLVEALRGPGEVAGPSPWAPRAALWQGERELIIQVELPGVPRDGLEVSFQGNVLTVSGSRPTPILTGDRPALRASEIPTGRFSRSFLVPPGAGTKEIGAQLRTGCSRSASRARRRTAREPRPRRSPSGDRRGPRPTKKRRLSFPSRTRREHRQVCPRLFPRVRRTR